MRTTIFGLLAAVAFVSATETTCANLEELVSNVPCGCPGKLSKCLGSKVDLKQWAAVKQCLVKSGCEEDDASEAVLLFADECEANLPAQDELKRRADFTTVDGDSTSEAKTTSKASAKTTAATTAQTTAKTTSTPSSTSATTTSDSTTSSSDSSSTPSSTTSTASTTSSSSTTTTTGSSTSSLQCSVTNMITTSFCSVSSGSTITCTPTVTPEASCAPGVICQTDNEGNGICLKKDDHLTTSGLIVAIVFGLSIAGAMISIIVVQAQTHSAQKRREKERIALLGGVYEGKGKGRAVADMEAARPFHQNNTSEAHMPLISGGTQQYQPVVARDVSPHDAPRLHPGLEALGQSERR